MYLQTLLKTGKLLHDTIFTGSLFQTAGTLQLNNDDMTRDVACSCFRHLNM